MRSWNHVQQVANHRPKGSLLGPTSLMTEGPLARTTSWPVRDARVRRPLIKIALVAPRKTPTSSQRKGELQEYSPIEPPAAAAPPHGPKLGRRFGAPWQQVQA